VRDRIRTHKLGVHSALVIINRGRRFWHGTLGAPKDGRFPNNFAERLARNKGLMSKWIDGNR